MSNQHGKTLVEYAQDMFRSSGKSLRSAIQNARAREIEVRTSSGGYMFKMNLALFAGIAVVMFFVAGWALLITLAAAYLLRVRVEIIDVVRKNDEIIQHPTHTDEQ